MVKTEVPGMDTMLVNAFKLAINAFTIFKGVLENNDDLTTHCYLFIFADLKRPDQVLTGYCTLYTLLKLHSLEIFLHVNNLKPFHNK